MVVVVAIGVVVFRELAKLMRRMWVCGVQNRKGTVACGEMAIALNATAQYQAAGMLDDILVAQSLKS